MVTHCITDWFVKDGTMGRTIEGYINGFGVSFRIKSINAQETEVKTPDGEVYLLHRKDMHKARPVKIDSIGLYKTRIGHVVTIFDIKGNGATFNCHGYRQHPNPKRSCGYDLVWNIWAPDGRFVAVGETDYDIVEKL